MNGRRDTARLRAAAIAGALAAVAMLWAVPTLRPGAYRVPAATTAGDAGSAVPSPLGLTIHMHFRDKYVWRDDWPVAREIARLTGVKLHGVASAATLSSREAFNLMLASGNLPDIVAGDNLKADFVRYGMEGAFAPLDALIAAHAPNLAAFLARRPEIRNAITAPDGNIYFIPYIPDGTFSRGWFIRADWLDRLGLAPPRTVDELIAVMRAFRDRDPNGNGRSDEIAFFAREWPEVLRLLTLWDARSSGSDQSHDFYIDGGRVVHPYATGSYRTGMAAIAALYREGLIDREIFTRGGRAREVMLGGNIGGITHDWFASTAAYNEVYRDKIPGFRFVPFDPPASVSGRRIEENRRARVKHDGWAITTANQHPVETIALFDFFFSDEGRRLANFGVEGQHYDLSGGIARFKPQVLASKTPVNTQMWAIGAQIPIGFAQDYAYERQWTDPIAQAGIDAYERGGYLVDDFLGVTLTAEERRVYDRYWPTVRDLMLEMQQSWIVGTRSIEADWPHYVAQLHRLHYDDVLAAMQQAYDRQQRMEPGSDPARAAGAGK